MNEQELTFALIEAKQEALNWQVKYMAQRKENERRVENLANGISKMLESQLENFTRIKENIDRLIDQFKKG